MEIRKNSIRKYDSIVGVARHYSCYRLPDGRASTGTYEHHDGPDYLGRYADVSSRPLTDEEWAIVDAGGEVRIF